MEDATKSLPELENWEVLSTFLPPQWAQQARSSGAMRRARYISDPAIVLRILLLHLASGCSLAETAARAQAAGLAKISAVGVFKRLRAARARVTLVSPANARGGRTAAGDCGATGAGRRRYRHIRTRQYGDGLEDRLRAQFGRPGVRFLRLDRRSSGRRELSPGADSRRGYSAGGSSLRLSAWGQARGGRRRGC